MIVPPDFTFPHEKARTAALAAALIAALVPRRRRVFQAGGCAGLWPLALSAYFEHVVTCEPAPTNFRCLAMNIAEHPTITAVSCAVGDHRGSVGLTREKPRAGLWTVGGDGDVPLRTIDELISDQPIDALVLDVEGHEVAAWRGAEGVIARDAPLLWFEGLHHPAEIAQFLDTHGYAPPTPGIGRDFYSRRTHGET